MNGCSTPSAEHELAQLKELCAKQRAAREELHFAVSSGDATRLRMVLKEAQDLLLDVEVQWGQRELSTLASRPPLEDSDGTIPSADQLLAEEEERQRRDEEEAAAQEIRRAEVEERAWKEVQDAINVDDEAALLKALQQAESLLPVEKVTAARRRIPGMRARADMRKELALAMKTPENLQNLKFVIAAARRSCLPQAEVLEAEEVLKAAEAKRSQAKAPKVRPAAAERDSSTITTTTNPVSNREPQTKLELAVSSKDKEQIQAAIAELKASGLSNSEVSYSYACARANFGG